MAVQIEYDRSIRRYSIMNNDYKAIIDLGVDCWFIKLYQHINGKSYITFYRKIAEKSMVLDEHVDIEVFCLKLSRLSYDEAVKYLMRLPAYIPKDIDFEDVLRHDGRVRIKIYKDAPMLHAEAYNSNGMVAELIDRVIKVFTPRTPRTEYRVLHTLTDKETFAEFRRILQESCVIPYN